MKILLSEKGWRGQDGVFVKGQLLNNGKFIEGEELLNFFSGCHNYECLYGKLRTANGKFAVIITDDQVTLAAADRLRQVPLFYGETEEGLVISDNCYTIAGLIGKNEFDPSAYAAFLSAGYSLSDRTLLRNIFQLEAGSLVSFGERIRKEYYHFPAREQISRNDESKTAEELPLLIESTFRKYFTALGERFVAIPLSGGYDSRLVALMASKYHRGGVLCYTYGRADNPEVKLAREIADRLNLEWINIVYDDKLVSGFLKDEFFETYYPYVANLTSMFFLQEYFAVRHLQSQNLIPSGTVFISGYSGDFIAGSYLTPGMNSRTDGKTISRIILNEYFRLVRPAKRERSEIMTDVCRLTGEGKSDIWRMTEIWDLKERHAKFIVNSAKVFTYFGYDYLFPLWDNALVDYMLSLPFKQRMNRKLYEYVLRDCIFKEDDLNLENETNPAPFDKSLQRIKEKIKPLIPGIIRNRFISSKNQIFYDGITDILRRDMGYKLIRKPSQPNYYNSYIIQWYLFKIAETFGIRFPE